MIIELAQSKDKPKIARLDSHMPPLRLGECIYNGQVYYSKTTPSKTAGRITDGRILWSVCCVTACSGRRSRFSTFCTLMMHTVTKDSARK